MRAQAHRALAGPLVEVAAPEQLLLQLRVDRGRHAHLVSGVHQVLVDPLGMTDSLPRTFSTLADLRWTAIRKSAGRLQLAGRATAKRQAYPSAHGRREMPAMAEAEPRSRSRMGSISLVGGEARRFPAVMASTSSSSRRS